MERDADLKYCPEGVKAIIMASAINDINGEDSDKIGVGGVCASRAGEIVMNNTYHTMTLDAGDFSGNQHWFVPCDEDKWFNAKAGDKIRVVCTWLHHVHPDIDPTNYGTHTLANLFGIHLRDESGNGVGGPGYSGDPEDNNYAVIDCQAPETGRYTIDIEAVGGFDPLPGWAVGSGERIALAWATWPDPGGPAFDYDYQPDNQDHLQICSNFALSQLALDTEDDFQAIYPSVEIEVECLSSPDCVESLLGNYDEGCPAACSHAPYGPGSVQCDIAIIDKKLDDYGWSVCSGGDRELVDWHIGSYCSPDEEDANIVLVTLRPSYMPTPKPVIQDYIDFMMGCDGQDIVVDNGFSWTYSEYDVQPDGSVDVGDLMIIAQANNFGQGTNPANPRTDVNNDCDVDVGDLFLTADNFHPSCDFE